MLKILHAVLLILSASGSLLGSAEVNVSVDRTRVTLNSVFQLTIEFVDFDDFPRFTPDLQGAFSIISGPSRSTNYSWINGVSTSSKKMTWSIAALRTGRLQIPAYDIRYKGRSIRTHPIIIEVEAAPDGASVKNAQGETRQIFIRAELTDDDIVTGESILLQYRLYYRTKVVNYSFSPLNSVPGFLLENIQSRNNTPESGTEIIEGIAYNTAVLRKILLTPTRSGRFTIPQQRVRLEVQRNSSRRSFFDDPFFSGFNTQNVDLLTDPVEIAVSELPPGAPGSFQGAVGEFRLQVMLDTLSIEADQAASFTVEVSGEGNLKNFAYAVPEFPESFQVFDPKMSEAVDLRGDRYRGRKSWEFIVIPSEPGMYRLPAAEFTFYSTERREYVTLRDSLPPVEVLPNSKLVQDLQKGFTQQQVALLNEDIRYIFTSEGRVHEVQADPLRRPAPWIPAIAAVTSLSLHYLFLFILAAREKDPVRLKRRRALAEAGKSLMSTEDPSEQDAAVRKYFAANMNLQIGEAGQSAVLSILRERGGEEELLKSVERMFRELEAFRFSPSAEGMKSPLRSEEILSVLKSVERTI